MEKDLTDEEFLKSLSDKEIKRLASVKVDLSEHEKLMTRYKTLTANELRIGNIVGCKSAVDSDVERVVHSIGFGGINLYVGLIEGEYLSTPEFEFRSMVGVPLTEEWLLKFGFEDNSYSQFSKKVGSDCYLQVSFKEYACVTLTEFVEIADHSFTSICKHVHQLQNLYFALTQTELTIK